MSETDFAYCARTLRRQDHDRYLTALFAPPDRRGALFALYAFNQELARARESVKEPLMGLMRLQWWRDALREIAEGRPRAHAVIRPLAEAIAAHGLELRLLERLVDSRERDMASEPPADLPALLDYADGSSGTLVLLALRVLGRPSPAVEEAGRDLGIAWALIGIARAVPFHAAQRRLYLPADLTAKAGLSAGHLFERGSSPALGPVVEALAEEARRRLAAVRRMSARLPRRYHPVFLQATLARGHLRRLEAAGYDPFDAWVQQAPPGRIWGLAGRRLIGII
jgi:NADH dehydrogenase [ubiquinone] 1 alpha subcomplex assembly factor 6